MKAALTPLLALLLADVLQAAPMEPDSSVLKKTLQLWLRADKLTLKDGAAVHIWPDRSGHGHDLTPTLDVRTDGAGTAPKFVVNSEVRDRPAVRFVQVNHSYPRNYWDAHGGLKKTPSTNAKKNDQPIAGLLWDLKSRGILDGTLMVFGTEFGRTPAAQGNDDRDYHPHAFTLWLAGGGIKDGTVHGATDDFGYYVALDEANMHDLHATMLHLLDLNHERLTYHYAGRDFRLTGVHGNVVKEIPV